MKLKRICYLNGTHWDREWYKPFQGFRYMLMGVIDEVIDTLERQKDFTVYVLDGQTAVLDDYCEIAPENRERLVRLIRAGRIAVGPWYTMPDEFLVSGESLIRNLLLGHAKARAYGAKEAMKYGYVCDIFGHIAQLPQILQGFGIQGALMQRGCNQDNTPPHFIWEAPDGSRVHAYRTPEDFGYGAFYHYATEPYNQGWDTSLERLLERAIREIDREAESLNAPYLVLHDALDHQHITKAAPWLCKKLSEHYGCPVALETPEQMAREALQMESCLPVRRGELAQTAHLDAGTNILLTYILSSRYDLKQMNDRVQNLWEKWAEPLCARARFTGHAIRPGFQREAYLELIRNHAHDSICGCAVQNVHRDMHYRFRQAWQIGQEVIEDCLNADVRALPADDGDKKLLLRVFNPLPIRRREMISVRICLSDEDCRWFSEGERPYEKKPSFLIRDMQGREVPYTLCDVRRDQIERTPTTYQTHWAQVLLTVDAGAMGYTDLELVPAAPTQRYRHLPGAGQTGLTMENASLRVDLRPDGTICLRDKRSGREYADLLSFRDDAEIGDGWMRIAPSADYTVFSQGAPSTQERLYAGPGGEACRIRLEMRVPEAMREAPGFMERCGRYRALPICMTLSLGPEDAYLGVDIQVENTCRDHRLRLALPLDIPGGEYEASQTFAFLKRPVGMDEETHDWKEPQTGERNFDGIVLKRDETGRGLAVITAEGLHEAAVMADERSTLLLTLFRAFEKTIGTNGEEDGQLQGTLSFALRLMPVDATVSNDDLARCRDAMKAPMRAYKAYVGQSHVPLASPAFVEVTGDAVVSAVKLPEDGAERELIVRLVHYGTDTGFCRLRFMKALEAAWLTNLLEEKQTPCEVSGDTVTLRCEPFKILTLRLRSED